MSNHFFNKINYSASNEDSESERTSLQISERDVVLCITGSGSRSLDLLIDSPKKIISIDLNPTQNFLLELKIAGYKSLTYVEFCEFIGLVDSNDRISIYQRIKDELSDEARIFWNEHKAFIRDGILYCGTWERILRQMLKFAFPRANKIKELLNAPTLKVQHKTWITKWDNRGWKWYLKILSNRFLWKYIIQEPGFQLIPKTFDVYAYMKARLDFMGTQINMSRAHFANLLFAGRYLKGCELPHHLRAENYKVIKNNLRKIEIVTDSLTDYLNTESDQITVFSLSDFSSYADEKTYSSIWQGVIKSARKNARFCERQYLVKRNPELQFSEISRDSGLEDNLKNTDESFIYTFCTGQIIKDK
jgi:S-adenosylmethionine-diacylglycerol 3-amino-3-carboxypropyl transferase